MGDEIDHILEGIDNNEAKTLKEDFIRARKQGETLESHIREAAKLVKKTKTVDVEKIKEEIKKELLEEKKKNTMKVETGSPTSAGGKRRITQAELEKMTPMEYAKLIKEGKLQI
jgi:hypothetical protein